MVPPVAETVQSNALPAVRPVVGHETVTTSGWASTLTLADPDALTVLVSVTVNDSVFVPFVGSVRLMVPVPVYGVVPPVAETVQLKAFPAVIPVVGHETVTTNGCAATLTLADPEALTVFVSVTVNDSVLVPLVGSVLEIVPVPV